MQWLWSCRFISRHIDGRLFSQLSACKCIVPYLVHHVHFIMTHNWSKLWLYFKLSCNDTSRLWWSNIASDEAQWDLSSKVQRFLLREKQNLTQAKTVTLVSDRLLKHIFERHRATSHLSISTVHTLLNNGPASGERWAPAQNMTCGFMERSSVEDSGGTGWLCRDVGGSVTFITFLSWRTISFVVHFWNEVESKNDLSARLLKINEWLLENSIM